MTRNCYNTYSISIKISQIITIIQISTPINDRLSYNIIK